MKASATVVAVNWLRLGLSDESPAPGTTRLTASWAARATTETPTHDQKKRQRIFGATEVSQRGRIRCTSRIVAQQTRIIAPSERLSSSRNEGPMSSRLARLPRLSSRAPGLVAARTTKAKATNTCTIRKPSPSTPRPRTGFHQA